MRKSKETKPALKGTGKRKVKKKKPGRGGARPGAGRKAFREPGTQVHLDMPASLLDAMYRAGETNKTGYIIRLVERDLKSRDFL